MRNNENLEKIKNEKIKKINKKNNTRLNVF